MFTGIVEAKGAVVEVTRRGQSARLQVQATWSDGHLPGVALGDSVAVNGVCLTVVDFSTSGETVSLAFDVSHETLARTSIGDVRPGGTLNLERALRVGDRMGGHWVTGHVDAVGRRLSVTRQGDAWDLTYSMPRELAPEFVAKGSVCIDGVSLTVNAVTETTFQVTIIPHTAASTQLLDGDSDKVVNLETDIVGKYLRRFAELAGSSSPSSSLTLAHLQRAGFVSKS